MNTSAKIVTVTFLAGTLALAGAGTASADTDTFLTDAHAAGFHNDGGNQAILTVGQTICTAVMNGESKDAVASELFHISQLDSLDMASTLVSISVKDLCPQESVT